MARFAHKLVYLRTRERKVSQAQLAQELRIRQATVSFLEQGLSQPNGPLLLELSKYFDVTPTYFLDDGRGLVPLPTDRWAMRDALVTVGMWVEVPEAALVHLRDGKVLCPLLPDEAFYDEEAMRVREQAPGAELAARASRRRQAAKKREERALVKTIRAELRAKIKKRVSVAP